MSTIQTVTETLIRLAKQAIHPDTVLVFPDDLFEVQRTPGVILQGPKLTEDRFRRSQSRLFEKNVAELSFEECRFPRLYHLDLGEPWVPRPPRSSRISGKINTKQTAMRKKTRL
ncbi:MAG: hypothetical protein WBN83_13770 [Desulfoprunum sp.]|uniref:hypothetical protein n=1 Tax=Desulfoprunum sp. TaxID=2020866 RepID=UPI0026B2D4FE